MSHHIVQLVMYTALCLYSSPPLTKLFTSPPPSDPPGQMATGMAPVSATVPPMLSAVAPIDDLSVQTSGTTYVQHFRHRPGEPLPTTASPALSLSHPSTHAELTFNECVSEVYNGLQRHPLTPAQSSLEMQIRGYKRPFVPTMHSPIKASTAYKCSPRRKKTRRMRSGTEGCKRNILQQMGSTSATARRPQRRKQPPPKDYFVTSEDEKKAMQELQQLSNSYILHKIASTSSDEILLDFQTYFSLSQNLQSPELSNIIYHSVLDQKADNNETLLGVINQLHADFIVSQKKQWVVLEGDAATYQRLQCIKAEYGQEMDWLIPMPGDWHMLKNYQEVLIKVYFDAGLSDLARASGYNPNGIGKNFKRTHHFLLETWEAMYRNFFSLFLKHSGQKSSQDFLEYVSSWLRSFPTSQKQHQCLRNLRELLDDEKDRYPNLNAEFQSFMEAQSSISQTWKFWNQFVFQDCQAYVSLFLAIRSGNWKLRMASIKSMAALFTAFDRPTYQKLIAKHIADVHDLPEPVLKALRSGGFSVSITGRACHSVGIDEAHEMCINKDCKECITKPSADYINRVSKFLPLRSKAIKNFEKQIFPDQKCKTAQEQITTLHSSLPSHKKQEMNVRAQEAKLGTNSTLTLDSNISSLHHIFSKKEASVEQVHDLLTFRDIGQREFEHRVEYFILRNPSVQAPTRRKRLLTFSERKVAQKRVSDLEKERKLQLECWKKKVAFASRTGTPIGNVFEQFLELPRAIATSEGIPNKGTKSNSTKVYAKRYEHAISPVVRSTFPPGWAPHVVLVEGMFLINISPWAAHFTMAHYAEFLIQQHILPHFSRGALEVHVIFDDPESQLTSPKQFERLRRATTNPSGKHNCTTFCDTTNTPKKWRDNVLNCRVCKRNLVVFLSQYFIKSVGTSLTQGQRFVTAGGFEESDGGKAYCVEHQSRPEPDPRLACNAEETDTRLWLHVKHSRGTRKLILSPDTDVYHIGLPLIANTDLDVLVKLNPTNSTELRLLDLRALLDAFYNDPDLASLPRRCIPLSIQMVYISTGCDFISFFHGLGKASFLNTLYQHAAFISSDADEPPGTLSDVNSEIGLLAFVRLVGCTYYHKHRSAFLPSYLSPVTHFNSFASPGQTSQQHHSAWLNDMRERIWSKVKYEEEMVPSDGALERHWQRSRWVADTWSQAETQVMVLKPLHGNGWTQNNSELEIDWDSPNNVEQIRHRVALIKKGCSCKTGCRNARCGCVKRDVGCGPGCTCLNCCNLPDFSGTPQPPNTLVDITIAETVGEEIDIDLEGNEDIDDIMQLVFGEWDDEINSDSELGRYHDEPAADEESM